MLLIYCNWTCFQSFLFLAFFKFIVFFPAIIWMTVLLINQSVIIYKKKVHYNMFNEPDSPKSFTELKAFISVQTKTWNTQWMMLRFWCYWYIVFRLVSNLFFFYFFFKFIVFFPVIIWMTVSLINQLIIIHIKKVRYNMFNEFDSLMSFTELKAFISG